MGAVTDILAKALMGMITKVMTTGFIEAIVVALLRKLEKSSKSEITTEIVEDIIARIEGKA